MNAIVRMSTISLCLGLLFAGCSKDSSSSILSSKMSATIAGTSWTASLPLVVKASSTFTITGTSLTGSVLTITITGATTGTYSVLSLTSGTNQCEATYTTISPVATYIAKSGSVVITSIDSSEKTISGTFSFTCTNTSGSIEIKSGKFTGLTYTGSK